MELNFQSERGITYELMESSDLSSNSWQPTGRGSTGTGSRLRMKMPKPGEGQKFYRIEASK